MATDTRTRAVHVADLEPSPYTHAADHWRTPRDGTQVRLYSRHQGHHVHCTILYIGPQGSGRRVHQGPIVPGPYAALIPQATVISAQPRQRAGVVDLQPGDRIVCCDAIFEIGDDRPGYSPRLYPITPPSVYFDLLASNISCVFKLKGGCTVDVAAIRRALPAFLAEVLPSGEHDHACGAL